MDATLKEIERRGYDSFDKLSEGGMGLIYTVRHVHLDQLRVAKCMKPDLAANPKNRERFLDEARTASIITHPNIARLYDFSADEDATFIIMEYVDGVLFEDLIRSDPLPSVGFCVELAIQALQAIQCLHEHNLVHRDIAPDNLMLTKSYDGRPLVKLIDLGIAKDLTSESTRTEAGTFMGKYYYASPEQLRETKTVTTASDLYSLGVVCYELLTGKRPIDGTSPGALVDGHLNRSPTDFGITDPAVRVPRPLRALVLELLAKNPRDRVSSAREAIRRLRALESDSQLAEDALEDVLERALRAAVGRSSATVHVVSQQRRLAKKFEQDGRVADALGIYEELLMLDPDDEQLQIRVATLRDQLERERRFDALIAKVESTLSSGALSDAADALREASSLFPDHSRVVDLHDGLSQAVAELRDRARTLEAAGQIEQARDAYDMLSAYAPQDAQLRTKAVELATLVSAEREISGLTDECNERLQEKDLHGARELLSRLRDIASDDARVVSLSESLRQLEVKYREQIDEANTRIEKEHYGRAFEAVTRAAAIWPAGPDIPSLRTRTQDLRSALVHSLSSDCRRAIEDAEQALGQDDLAVARDRLAEALRKCDRLRLLDKDAPGLNVLLDATDRVQRLLESHEDKDRDTESVVADANELLARADLLESMDEAALRDTLEACNSITSRLRRVVDQYPTHRRASALLKQIADFHARAADSIRRHRVLDSRANLERGRALASVGRHRRALRYLRAAESASRSADELADLVPDVERAIAASEAGLSRQYARLVKLIGISILATLLTWTALRVGIWVWDIATSENPVAVSLDDALNLPESDYAQLSAKMARLGKLLPLTDNEDLRTEIDAALERLSTLEDWQRRLDGHAERIQQVNSVPDSADIGRFCNLLLALDRAVEKNAEDETKLRLFTQARKLEESLQRPGCPDTQ